MARKGIYAKCRILTGSTCIKDELYILFSAKISHDEGSVDTQHKYGNIAEPLQTL